MTGRLPGLLGVVGILATGAALTAGSTVLPAVSPSAAAGEALPIARSAAPLVCPGPETLLVPDGGLAVNPGAPVLISALVGSSSGPSSARLQLLGDRSAQAVEAGQGAASSAADGAVPITRADNLSLTAAHAGPTIAALATTALGPAVLKATVVPDADQAAASGPTELPALAAVQSTLVRSGDLRSLAATTCSVPVADSWLVGGATEDGERLRLLLANPAATAAVVDVDVHGPTGRVRSPSGEGIVVPAGAEVPIFIDALAPGLKQVAVHVTTRSGRVRATLHDSRLRGLDPGGADDVPVAADAAKHQVIPGISLVNGFGKTADDPAAAGSTAVRVAVPGSEEAVVRVRLLDPSGSVELPRAAVVNVPAGGVVDVPIAGIASGTYTAIVDADVPVVAGALIGRGGVAGAAPASEFAWAGAVRPLAGRGYVLLPPGTRSALSLAATKRASRLAISEVHADGSIADPKEAEIPAGASITVSLGPEAVGVWIDTVDGSDPTVGSKPSNGREPAAGSAAPVTAAVVSWVSDLRGSLISVLSVNLTTDNTPPRIATQDRTLGLR